MSRIKFFDATLRDGSHAINHQFSLEDIENYCQYIDKVGMYTVIVGHGNGLGASSVHIGLSQYSDRQMLEVARENLRNTKLGIYMIPGFGTIKEDLQLAISIGIDVAKIGCHCTEADTTRQHIEYLRNLDIETYGVLMMYHMASPEKLLEEAKKMETYGANGVILMDSAGASTPEMVRKAVSELYDNLNIKIGFHAHNNLNMAVSNTYIAIQEGASIVDGTVRGFGAGAGNCQLEALAAVLQKEEIKTGLDLYSMMDVSEKIVSHFSPLNKGLDDISIINGLAGTFSTFQAKVIDAAKLYKVDARDILMELGKMKAVGGQEDLIIQIANKLSMNSSEKDETYYLSSLL